MKNTTESTAAKIAGHQPKDLRKILLQEGQDTFSQLIVTAQANNATDIHIQETGCPKLRVGGHLLPFLVPGGRVEINGPEFNRIVQRLECTLNETRVWRLDNLQVRVGYFQFRGGKALALRLQPAQPPKLNLLFKDPEVPAALQVSKGLILVVGSIGGGKTTLASSIAQAWASAQRHIMTLEDPVEYMIKTDGDEGQITQVDCTFKTKSQSPIPSFDDAIINALRSDIDGMYIGECRNATVLRCALDFATAYEPVVTTLHARDIADAILRVIAMASKEMAAEVVKLTLLQCLHTILHVRLGFDQDGLAVPIVTAFPFWRHDEKIAKSLSTDNAGNLRQVINEKLNNGYESEGYISEEKAIRFAIERNATQESIEAVVPDAHQFIPEWKVTKSTGFLATTTAT
jgi:Tfp pilus assembly pilus retraction ATPase PilT